MTYTQKHQFHSPLLWILALVLGVIIIWGAVSCSGGGGNGGANGDIQPHTPVVGFGKTDNAGNASITLGSITLPFTVQDSEGNAISGMYVSAALEEDSTSRAAVVMIDPLGRYPSKLSLLTGEQQDVVAASTVQAVGQSIPVVVPVPSGHDVGDYSNAMAGAQHEIVTGLLSAASGEATGKTGAAIGTAIEHLVYSLPCSDYGFCVTASVSPSIVMSSSDALVKDAASVVASEGPKLISSYLPKNSLVSLEYASNGITFVKQGFGGLIATAVVPVNATVNVGLESIYTFMGYSEVKRTDYTITLKNLPIGDIPFKLTFTEPHGKASWARGWTDPESLSLNITSGGSPIPTLASDCELVSLTTFGLGFDVDCSALNPSVPPGDYQIVIGASGYGRTVALGYTSDTSVNVDILPLSDAWLGVAKDGSGSGTVTSNPIGINCGGDCSEVYALGTPVELTAEVATGSSFAGWIGECSGTSKCNLTMDKDKAIIAEFTQEPIEEHLPCSAFWNTTWSGTFTWEGKAGTFSYSLGEPGTACGNVPVVSASAQIGPVLYPSVGIARLFCHDSCTISTDYDGPEFQLELGVEDINYYYENYYPDYPYQLWFGVCSSCVNSFVNISEMSGQLGDGILINSGTFDATKQ